MPEISRARKLNLYERDGWRCWYCGRHLKFGGKSHDPDAASLDHRIPRHAGGRSAAHNLVACCYGCNQAKDNRGGRRFLQILRNTYWPTRHPVQPIKALVKET